MLNKLVKKKYIFLGDTESINIEIIVKSHNFLKNKIKYLIICNKSEFCFYLTRIKSKLKVNEILDPIKFNNYKANYLNVFNIEHKYKEKYKNLLNQLDISKNLSNLTSCDLITMPIDKSIFKKKIKFNGLTEYLGKLNACKTAMLMHGEKFSIIPLTTHINLKEVHSLAFSNIMLKYDNFQELDYAELAGLLSCFTNLSIQDELKDHSVKHSSSILVSIIDAINDEYEEYFYYEKKHQLDTGESYDIHFDLVSYIINWCKAENEIQCKQVIHNVYHEKGVFLGEFVKSILKINNILTELEEIAELINDMKLLEKCKTIQEKTLKYIVLNQSLYI